jgi:hypothetical protein
MNLPISNYQSLWFKSPRRQSTVCWGIVLFGLLGCSVQAQQSSSPSANSSWTAASQQGDPSGALNPIRTRTEHTQQNGRTIDTQYTERLGPDGRYQPYLETETESVQVNATTTRTVNRTFVRDSDGGRTLSQETRQEALALPDQEKKVTSTTSSVDANGQLQVVQRQIQDTKQTSPGVRETKTQVLMPSSNGGLAPSMTIEERQTKRSDQLTEFKKAIMLPDLNGNMQTNEIRQGTITTAGKDTTKEENVLRLDNDGKFAVIQKTVTKEAANGSGGTQRTSDTYSSTIPGGFVDTGLALTQHESSVQSVSSDGTKRTVAETDGRNPGAPGDGLGLTEKTIDILRPGVNGTAQEQRTIESSNANGGMNVVWVDTNNIAKTSSVIVDTKQNKTPAAPVSTTAAKKQ